MKADQTLRDCAIAGQDARIIAITNRDIFAAEAHCHVSCYRAYTRLKTAAEPRNDDDDSLMQDA